LCFLLYLTTLYQLLCYEVSNENLIMKDKKKLWG